MEIILLFIALVVVGLIAVSSVHTDQKIREEEERNRKIIAEPPESGMYYPNAGHVYIISNIGSFGPNVYKIGMTKRVYPEDRVKELSDASVPFIFDIHAMIETNDANGLERYLHNHFHNSRVNKVNNRKEFFRLTYNELVSGVHKVMGHDRIKIRRSPGAHDFRRSYPDHKDT